MRNLTSAPLEPVPLEGIDLFDPERFQHGSQHAAWHALRESHPVWVQTGPGGERFWSITRYRDVLPVIKDHRRYSSEHGTILAVLGGDTAGGKTINLMDQPKHRALRVPTMPLLAGRTMAGHAPAIRAEVRTLVDRMIEEREIDFAREILQIALIAVGRVVGVPRSFWADVPVWAMAGVAPADPTFATGSVEETLQSAHYELFAMFQDLIRERRRVPQEDVITALLGIEFDGKPLPPEEVLLNCYSFMMGANTTTPHVASHMVLALAERPDQWHRLCDDPGLVPSAVEESLRWATPTNHLLRKANVDVTVAGTHISAGETLCAWIASANRDDRVFDSPYEFRVDRSPNPHIAFGSGIHFCNGALAARLVLASLLAELVARAPDLAVAGPVTHLRSNFINGITSLPIALRVPVGTGLGGAR